MARKHRSASALLASKDRSRTRRGGPSVDTLIHELRVQAEEISAQNALLLRVQDQLEEARDRYADLYDLAPIGYLSLDQRGTILDVNLVGAELLGSNRAFLTNLPLYSVIAEADRRPLKLFLDRTEDGTALPMEIEVRSRRTPPRVLRL